MESVVGSDIPFGVRWDWDLRSLLGADCDGVLLDVGANVGQTAAKLVVTLPRARVYSFEPVPAAFADLTRNTASLAHVECVPVALGSVAGEGVITTDRNARNSMVPGVPSLSSTTVAVETVDRFCAQRAIDRVALLKVDAEGYELPVLDGAATMLGEGRIDFVVVECEFARWSADDPHGDFFAIHDLLSACGFRVLSCYTGGISRRGWSWGDAMFIRQGCADHVPVLTSPFGAPARPPD